MKTAGAGNFRKPWNGCFFDSLPLRFVGTPQSPEGDLDNA